MTTPADQIVRSGGQATAPKSPTHLGGHWWMVAVAAETRPCTRGRTYAKPCCAIAAMRCWAGHERRLSWSGGIPEWLRDGDTYETHVPQLEKAFKAVVAAGTRAKAIVA